MFDFRKIELADRERVNECLKISDRRGCEFCFANNLAWQRLSDSVICIHDGFYINCGFDDGAPFIMFPAGVKTDDEAGRQKHIKLFAELEKHFGNLGHKLKIVSVSEYDLEWIKQYYGDRIEVEYNRDGSDYIYNSSDLIELAGKKYHGKRNHIKRFMENEWSFEPLDDNNFDECVLFSASFYNERGNTYGSAAIEQFAINTFFMEYKTLRLDIGLLRSEGELVGFSIGERLNSDTYVVHVEKSRADIQGAYPMLCNVFARTYAKDFKYINREEDMGIEGLRKSKLSYHPIFLENKYRVKFK